MKHVPMRMCVQTRERKPKNELVRFVIDPDSARFSIDKTGKIRSRGANLSIDLDVYDQAVKSGAFERALDVKISQEDYSLVRKEFIEYLERLQFRKGKDKVSVRVKGKDINLG